MSPLVPLVLQTTEAKLPLKARAALIVERRVCPSIKDMDYTTESVKGIKNNKNVHKPRPLGSLLFKKKIFYLHI